MQEVKSDKAIRSKARAFEEALPPAQRKNLGQFFTGMPLGRILAHLAVDSETKCILDPMAGSGDLLDAAREASAANATKIERLDAIEIDEATAVMCNQRLRRVCGARTSSLNVVCADAFDPGTLGSILDDGYDLVITNPPYVRYQSLNGRKDDVRHRLLASVNQRLSGSAQKIWKTLSEGYSGLADLSVPAWLLSALLVRPGGRLAIVVPATWRSRAYADVIRYLLLRSFELELIIEDSQPGWFSDALVRTHLIVARRLPENEAAEQLGARSMWPVASWIQVAPDAASSSSLVGSAFPGSMPEVAFRDWCRASERSKIDSIKIRKFPLEDEWHVLRERAADRSWMKILEQSEARRTSYAQNSSSMASVPESLRDLLPVCFDKLALCPLSTLGIHTGQGLRTGCNRFFYVRSDKKNTGLITKVTTDTTLGGKKLDVPAGALRPVLHRQADLAAWRKGLLPATCVLDLRRMILPEDLKSLHKTMEPEYLESDKIPTVMPRELSAHVRKAARTSLGRGENAQPISSMSAVKTNVRRGRGGAMPRFWYMLPDFMPRHLPEAFVPRVINDAPQVYTNTEPPILIDANFSTFWTHCGGWTSTSLDAFLNSTWCRAVMEAIGTPLGGGALKLEAIHLREMAVPFIDPSVIESLNKAELNPQHSEHLRKIDRIVLRSVLTGNPSETEIDAFARALEERRVAMASARRGGSS